MIVAGQADLEIEVSLPLSRLESTDTVLKGANKKLAEQFAKKAFDATVANLANNEYRSLYRKHYIRAYLTREVKAALKSTSKKRSFDLGMLSPDVDCEFLGLEYPRVAQREFCYKKQNLGDLDALLGHGWDVSTINGLSTYVTLVRVKVTPDLNLTGNIQVADYSSVVVVDKNCGYRHLLQDHMNPATIEQEEEEEPKE